MSVVLVFLLVTIGFSLWWLAQQRVLSKPWLEVGPDPLGGPGETGLPTEKIALGILLAVIGALFALFGSAYFMRMEFADWRDMPIPRIVWVNTGLLVLASVLLHCALVASRRGDRTTLRLGLAAGTAATLAFLAGQLAAWRELAAGGFLLSGNPADSFFYLLTGLHGLHVLAGLAVLALIVAAVFLRPRDGVDEDYRDLDFTREHARGADPGAPGSSRREQAPPAEPDAAGNFTRGQARRSDPDAPGNFTRDQARRSEPDAPGNFTREQAGPLSRRLELCATYWHFLLLVWLGLLVLFTGTAAEVVAICRQILT